MWLFLPLEKHENAEVASTVPVFFLKIYVRVYVCVYASIKVLGFVHKQATRFLHHQTCSLNTNKNNIIENLSEDLRRRSGLLIHVLYLQLYGTELALQSCC